MHELIECRACQAPYCNGCNMFTLSQALHKGYFDRFMEDGHHTIYIDTLKQDRMTNADRIRAMTDEELAVSFSEDAPCGTCPAKRKMCEYGDGCYEAWLDWLKQEVGE